MPTVQDLLTFERHHPRATSGKNELIRNELGIAPAVYYRDLLRAAQSLEGWEYDTFTADRVIMRVKFARDRRATWLGSGRS
ncbi:uncharacterized protein DUF3263 [Microbacterium sp. AG1240]|uniref:DUF3263 domain-containing protein n=1 Tax=Microbacterium sp. AG1240 TaxID=2183992 RepID=UPI000EADC620|nr:DUF3263 domain-containing protein [Microbacterium sp. AG1240]RKT33694.1 uncharacterized protein DUF3263 [Microbacterium sp. AG1240]